MSRYTELAQWRGPSPNRNVGYRSRRGVVVHIASGYYEGTIAWQMNPAVDVSSHFVVGRDGRRAQVVDTNDTAWTERDGNPDWLSIEFEGFAPDDPLHASHPGWERLTDQQIDAGAQLLARAHVEWGFPLQLATSPAGYGLGYHSMGAEHGINWGHLHCPGEAVKEQLPEMLARAEQIINGTNGDEDEMGMWQGPVPAGPDALIVCTPWDVSQISFGTDLGIGMAKLRVAEHLRDAPDPNKAWVVTEFVIKSTDRDRRDLLARRFVDRRSIQRVKLTTADGLPDGVVDNLDTPVGYLAWTP